MDSIEQIILNNLIKNETFSRKVLPFLTKEYFQDRSERFVYETISDFIIKYNSLPTKEALFILIDKNKIVSDDEVKKISTIVDNISKDVDPIDQDWLATETESFCREKAIYNAIMESINIIDGKSANAKGAIPDILSKALAVSFDPNVGHDYIQDYDKRYDFYHMVEQKIPFDLEFFNMITKDGITPKTLNVVMAGCVHPNTKVSIRYKERNFQMWLEKETKISEIRTLLEEGYEVEVTSPDGYVPVSAFVDKGTWKEYVLNTDLGDEVWCNENHLFETDRGWILAKDLVDTYFKVLTKDGFIRATVIRTGHDIPIVDIQVDHENHRYYTNGISSHNTGVGKSLFLCHHAVACLKQNKNVLYITCEMAEERIAERIDANLLDVNLDDLKDLSKQIYEKKIQSASVNITGKLIIKEYPTATANVNHFRFLLDELKLKKKFKPDIIFVDYLNICSSSRHKGAKNINSYEYVKSIAEELRGLAIEYNVPIFTATQTNRAGYSNTDVDLENTSESFGLPATADFMFALIATDELDELNQIMVKQLKNRYNDKVKHRKFILGINRAKMKLFDAKKEDQSFITDAKKKQKDEEDDFFNDSPKQSSKKFKSWKV